MKTNISVEEHGILDIFHKFNNGEEKHVISCENMALSNGAAVLANAIGGRGGLSYLYVLFTNDETVTYPAIDKSTTLSTFTDGNQYIKVPVYLIGDTVITTDDTAGSGEITGANIVIQGITANADGYIPGSKVYAAALAGTVNGTDILMCATTIKDANSNNSFITKLANAQIGINWKINIML